MGDLFYKTCRHGNVGSNVMFHNKGELGYGTDLKNLETYNQEQAQKEMNRQDGSLMLLKYEVDKLSVLHVDMQYLDKTKGHPTNEDDRCIIQINGKYDGNDIKFISELGETFDLSKARIVDYKFAVEHSTPSTTIWLASYLESISRHTFQACNINKREMISAGGVRYRTPRKSTASGKERGNCPQCGKITWSYNPHENDFCNDDCYEIHTQGRSRWNIS